MFIISSLFLYWLLLILENTFKLAANAVSKDLVIFKKFSNKIFRFGLYYWVIGFKVIFILMPLLNYHFLEK